jgi:hypothetical protein
MFSHEVFSFEVGSALIDIQSSRHMPWSSKSDGSATGNPCEDGILISVDRRRVMHNMRIYIVANVDDVAE